MKRIQRRIVSITLTLAFLLLLASGIAMYLRPEGSLADWLGWSFLGLAKKEWESLHTAGAVLFCLVALLHLWNNLHALLVYLRRKRVLGLPVEALLGVGIAFTVTYTAIADLQPATTVNATRSAIKRGAFSALRLPPVERAVDMPLHLFSKALDIDLEQMITVIRERSSVEVDSLVTVQEAANICRITPEELYRALTEP